MRLSNISDGARTRMRAHRCARAGRPEEYVKVCSLYGAGFYYIPGTDTCIKIGGFVRTEWLHNAGGSFGPSVAGGDGLYTRSGKDLVNRSRFITSFDVRS